MPPGAISQAAAGIKAPSTGSTLGDLTSIASNVMAGLEERRRANQAQALEEAKLEIQRGMMEAQQTQAGAYADQVALQGVQFEHDREMDLAEEARAEELHGVTLRSLEVATATAEDEYSNLEGDAQFYRENLRRFALNNPGKSPFSASSVDAMSNMALAENYKWMTGFIQAETNQSGAIWGSTLGQMQDTVSAAINAERQAFQDLSEANRYWEQMYSAASSPGFFAFDPLSGRLEETQQGIEYRLALTPEEKAAYAQLSASVNEALALKQMAQQRYEDARRATQDAHRLQADMLRNVGAYLNQGVVRPTVEGADAAAGGEQPAPGQVPRSSMESLLRSYSVDPGYFQQQMSVLNQRFPGAATQFMEFSGIDENQLNAAMVNQQDSVRQAVERRAMAASGATSDTDVGRSEHQVRMFGELVDILRAPEGARVGQRALAVAQDLKAQGVTRSDFILMMEGQIPRATMQSDLFQRILDTWPNRIGAGSAGGGGG